MGRYGEEAGQGLCHAGGSEADLPEIGAYAGFFLDGGEHRPEDPGGHDDETAASPRVSGSGVSVLLEEREG